MNSDAHPRAALTEEIVGCARLIWYDPQTRAAIEAVGVDGDLENSVSEALASTIQQIGHEHFPGVAIGHLSLAEPILRRLSEGEYAGFDDPKIDAFIQSHKVPLSGPGWAPARPTPLPVIIGWFRYFESDREIKEMFLRSKDKEFLNAADMERLSAKVAKRIRKYGLQYAHGSQSFAQGFFHDLCTADSSTLSDGALIEIFENDTFYGRSDQRRYLAVST